MILKYEHLVGIPFEHGKDDCFGLARRFYMDNFNIELTNYARPDRWWETDLDLYSQHFYDEGFRVQDIQLKDVRKGDGFLMAVRSKVPNHCGVYLGEGLILHHFYGRMSEVTSYRGLWRNATTAIVRHKDIEIPPEEAKTVDLMTILPTHARRRLQGAIDAGQV